MKETISIFILMLVVCVITISCGSNKNHGLVKHSCQGNKVLKMTKH